MLGLPLLIKDAFLSLFDRLFRFLDDILSAIFGIPIDIVSAVNNLADIVSDFSLSDIKDILKDAAFTIPILSVLNNILGGIIDIPTDIISAGKSVVDAVTDLPGNILKAISDVSDFVISIPDEISETIADVGTAVRNIPGEIADEIGELLEAAFIPSDNFFNDWKNDFEKMLKDKLPYDTYDDFFNDIKVISQSRLHDITVNLFGQKCTVVTFKWYYDYEKEINHFIRGVTFIVLIFFNINQRYKLIRGTSLYRVEKYMDM